MRDGSKSTPSADRRRQPPPPSTPPRRRRPIHARGKCTGASRSTHKTIETSAETATRSTVVDRDWVDRQFKGRTCSKTGCACTTTVDRLGTQLVGEMRSKPGKQNGHRDHVPHIEVASHANGRRAVPHTRKVR